MRTRIVVAIILLAVGLCFVSGVGYGEVDETLYTSYFAPHLDLALLKGMVRYMMYNPTSFLNVNFEYDQFGGYGKGTGLNTKGKIFVTVRDSRGRWSKMSGRALLDEFKSDLETIHSFIQLWVPDMDTDIWAVFDTKLGNPLGSFYEGEYHLWSGKKQDVSESSKHGKRTYSGLGGGHWIAEKIERGRQIKLEDGSLWKISVRHRLKTMLWETSEQITVAENDDLLYSYRLINQNTGDTVEAELVSE